jgi:hypothetical protein
MPASCKLLSEVDALVLRVDEVGMSFDENQKSDRFQVMAAVLFMTLFAGIFLIAIMPKGNMTKVVCNFVGTSDVFARMCSNESAATPSGHEQIISSRIYIACVDSQGLKISVAFDERLAGEANIQVFSTGPDFFPSEQGMTDTYDIYQTLTTAVDHLDLIIPVESMPIGEQIFGNIVVDDDNTYSHLAYVLEVSDCSTNGVPSSTPAVSGTPVIQNATCLPSRQLMITFEFDGPVLGQYQVLISDIPYRLSSVVSQPALLFFSGEPPPSGPIVISLISATNEVTVFEETYTPPVCGGA